MGDDMAESLTQAGQQPPNLANFPQGHVAYQIIDGDAATQAENLAALDVLCIYYDSNKAEMIADYQQREAANAKQRQWLLEHPSVQKDTTVYFWPIQNSAYLQSGS